MTDQLSFILKSKRESSNLSLREAAMKIGVSHGYLDKLEKGYDERTGTANKPTPETLRLIGIAYGLDYTYLLEICGYILPDSLMPTNKDIRVLARAGKKMSPIQAEQLRKYAEYMFPEAFKDDTPN